MEDAATPEQWRRSKSGRKNKRRQPRRPRAPPRWRRPGRRRGRREHSHALTDQHGRAPQAPGAHPQLPPVVELAVTTPPKNATGGWRLSMNAIWHQVTIADQGANSVTLEALRQQYAERASRQRSETYSRGRGSGAPAACWADAAWPASCMLHSWADAASMQQRGTLLAVFADNSLNFYDSNGASAVDSMPPASSRGSASSSHRRTLRHTHDKRSQNGRYT